MKSLRLVLLVLLLQGCSSLNPIDMAKSALSDDKGMEIDTELVVGDKEESNHNEGQIGHRQKASTINNITEIPLTLLLLMVLGWMLPSPAEIWRGFTNLLPWVGRK